MHTVPSSSESKGTKVYMSLLAVMVSFLLFSASAESVRLPVVGADTNAWGDIFNAYLAYLAGPNATALNMTVVNADNINTSAVNTTHILDNNITSDDLAASSVGNSELADNAVTTEKILNGTIASGDLGTDSVTNEKIADGAVTSAEINDSSITGDDIDNTTSIVLYNLDATISAEIGQTLEVGTGNTPASYSVAFGTSCSTGYDGALAVGINAAAMSGSTGPSFAMGRDVTADDPYSFAMGHDLLADAPYSFAYGRYSNTTSSADYGIAMGYACTVFGNDYATAIGYSSYANGTGSFAIGYGPHARGDYSAAIGRYTIASGMNSFAMGREIEAAGNYTIAVSLNDSNGMVVSQNNSMVIMGGYLGVGNVTPSRPVHISDVMRLDPRATAPLSPAAGDVYYDSTSNDLCIYNSTAWVEVTKGGTCA